MNVNAHPLLIVWFNQKPGGRFVLTYQGLGTANPRDVGMTP